MGLRKDKEGLIGMMIYLPKQIRPNGARLQGGSSFVFFFLPSLSLSLSRAFTLIFKKKKKVLK
jgi:hypothetical protein